MSSNLLSTCLTPVVRASLDEAHKNPSPHNFMVAIRSGMELVRSDNEHYRGLAMSILGKVILGIEDIEDEVFRTELIGYKNDLFDLFDI
jgi:hypothetical protein